MSPSFDDLHDDPRWPLVSYWWYRKRKEVLRLIARQLARVTSTADRSNIFIDFGCGTGKDLGIVSAALSAVRANWRFIGCDADPQFEPFIANLASGRNVGSSSIEFLQADVSGTIAFDARTVGVAYCSEVVEHLEHPEALLAEISRVLIDGGLLILTTPNQPSITELGYYRSRAPNVARAKALESDGRTVRVGDESARLYGHISVKTIGDWERILERLGFVRIESGRGAMRYDLPEWCKRSELILGTYFLLEGLVDLLPRAWTRYLGSELVAMYELRAAPR